MKQTKHSERLGTESIPRLMTNLSVPAFVGMFVMALYNVVDTIFIARGVGTLGVAGLSIVFPIQMILGAFAAAIGIGGSTIISRRLGEKREEEANNVFGHVTWLVTFFSLIMLVLALLFLEPILRMFGATDAIMPYASDYLSIILFGTIFHTFAMSNNNVVRAEGNATMAMKTMLVASLLNIALDPVFIFGFDMGMQGAALATVISQASAAVWIFMYFRSGKSTLRFTWIGLIPELRIVKEIAAIGSGTFVRQVSSSSMVIVVNLALVQYGGELEVAVFGIIIRLLMFTVMPMFGIVQGMQPIVGYNYGANLMERVRKTVTLSITTATLIALTIWMVIQAFPGFFMGIFTEDSEVIRIGVNALGIIFLVTPLVGFQMISGGLYQALGKAKISFVLSMARQLLFLIPMVLILPTIFGLQGVWMAFPVSDTLAFILSLAIFLRDRKKIFTSRSAVRNPAVS
ncbi:multidrug transporter MatE [Bacillus coahuilensis m2-6]|uniref:MATE family efflux transporter n=1 Tax=Bacillus coahuilensis TaxID=408580 RepID=UPI00075056C1|nr:MATE family efflux transporter [Bacillus coahuilensis]KUP10003.1 multidrug transporter MatE [Bacillus coahuilensis m2-6]